MSAASKQLVYGADDRVGEWVSQRTEGYWVSQSGVTIGYEQNGELIAGVVFSNWSGTNMFLDVAGTPGKLWLTQEFLHAVFRYVFVEAGCQRATGLVDSNNKRARRLNSRLGFELEASLPGAVPNGDLLIYCMWRDNCPWRHYR